MVILAGTALFSLAMENLFTTLWTILFLYTYTVKASFQFLLCPKIWIRRQRSMYRVNCFIINIFKLETFFSLYIVSCKFFSINIQRRCHLSKSKAWKNRWRIIFHNKLLNISTWINQKIKLKTKLFEIFMDPNLHNEFTQKWIKINQMYSTNENMLYPFECFVS